MPLRPPRCAQLQLAPPRVRHLGPPSCSLSSLPPRVRLPRRSASTSASLRATATTAAPRAASRTCGLRTAGAAAPRARALRRWVRTTRRVSARAQPAASRWLSVATRTTDTVFHTRGDEEYCGVVATAQEPTGCSCGLVTVGRLVVHSKKVQASERVAAARSRRQPGSRRRQAPGARRRRPGGTTGPIRRKPKRSSRGPWTGQHPGRASTAELSALRIRRRSGRRHGPIGSSTKPTGSLPADGTPHAD